MMCDKCDDTGKVFLPCSRCERDEDHADCDMMILTCACQNVIYLSQEEAIRLGEIIDAAAEPTEALKKLFKNKDKT